MNEGDLCGTCGGYWVCEHKTPASLGRPRDLPLETWADPLTDVDYANLIVHQHASLTNDSWSSRDAWATYWDTDAFSVDVSPSTKKTSTS